MSTNGAKQALETLNHRVREYSILESCQALLGWDERTYMPQAGGTFRSEQLALLAGMV
ncbi:MAG: hypothetical protein IIB00_11390, partial [candidate division Zixibacteria bacterium]|nr:hypothetical protein [candidate division Zixibacteria bacterium]